MKLDKDIKFFKKLNQYQVKYLLIGRQACILYGLPVYTFDYDIAVDNLPENLKKILKIAHELELYPSKDEEKILQRKIPFFNLQDEIKIDVFCAKKFVTVDGENVKFEEVFLRKVEKFDKKLKIKFYLPAIKDLILFKKIKPREKDLEDIKALEIIKRKLKE